MEDISTAREQFRNTEQFEALENCLSFLNRLHLLFPRSGGSRPYQRDFVSFGHLKVRVGQFYCKVQLSPVCCSQLRKQTPKQNITTFKWKNSFEHTSLLSEPSRHNKYWLLASRGSSAFQEAVVC